MTTGQHDAMTGPPSGRRLRLDLPAGFAAVRLDAAGLDSAGSSLDAQARGLVGRLRASNPAAPTDDAEQTIRAVTGVLDMFAALNVQLIGKFAVATPAGPTTATVAVAVHPLPVEDPRSAAADLPGLAGAVREVVRRRHPEAELRVVTLPIGPTVVGVWFGALRLPAGRTGPAGAPPDGAQDVIVPTYRVQFLIPLPTAEHLVALDVSTASEPGWPVVARQAVSIANSVRFSDAG